MGCPSYFGLLEFVTNYICKVCKPGSILVILPLGMMYACTPVLEELVVQYACPGQKYNAIPEPLEYFQQYSGQLPTLDSENPEKPCACLVWHRNLRGQFHCLQGR